MRCHCLQGEKVKAWTERATPASLSALFPPQKHSGAFKVTTTLIVPFVPKMQFAETPDLSYN
jgi:hypothetical protein